jgi:hypothetical protein
MIELGRAKNQVPLPVFRSVHLPPPEYCNSGANYQVSDARFYQCIFVNVFPPWPSIVACVQNCGDSISSVPAQKKKQAIMDKFWTAACVLIDVCSVFSGKPNIHHLNECMVSTSCDYECAWPMQTRHQTHARMGACISKCWCLKCANTALYYTHTYI